MADTILPKTSGVDMLMVYNILHGMQCQFIVFHQQLSSVTRGHSLKLIKPRAQRSVQSNFFSIRC